MTEKEKIGQLIRSSNPETIELAITMAFSMGIDIASEKLLRLYHSLYPSKIYQKDKVQKLSALLSQRFIQLHDMFPDQLRLLPNLESIAFSGFSHYTLPAKNLWQLQQLKSFYFHGIELLDFGYRFHLLSNLSRVAISYCRMSPIHQNFYTLPKLETLELQGITLESFNEKLLKMETIKTLRIIDSRVGNKSLEMLLEMTFLEHLELGRTDIKNTEVRKLKKLLKNTAINIIKK